MKNQRSSTAQQATTAPELDGPVLDGPELWREWQQRRFVNTAAACLKHEELSVEIERLKAAHSEVRVEIVGRSFEGRSIQKLTVGRGEQKILLWSQMHGDEPSATPALLDLVDFLMRNREHPRIAAILDSFELHFVPMLNPDGSERFERRNAQGIDINRDALNLATPEGRLLKELRDRLEPFLGFNLHDQNRRTLLPDTGKLSSMSVLAVAGDEAGTETAGRLRAMRACAAIVASTAFHLDGRIGRYDEDWSPRAFGDNLTAWGTPVVLIESGGVPPGHSLSDLTALNFVALVSVLDQLAVDDLASFDEKTYRELPRTGRGYSDLVLRGGFILQPGTRTHYRADISFNRVIPERTTTSCANPDTPSYSDATRSLRPTRAFVTEVGDARYEVGGEELTSSSSLFLRPLTVALDSTSLSHQQLGAGESARRDEAIANLLERLLALGVGTVYFDHGADGDQGEEAGLLVDRLSDLATSSDRLFPRLESGSSTAEVLTGDVLDAVFSLEPDGLPRTLGEVLILLSALPPASDPVSTLVAQGNAVSEDDRIQPGSRADLLELKGEDRSAVANASPADLLELEIGALFLSGQRHDRSALTAAVQPVLP